MPTDEQWPPASAYDALLSSPSGRRKYADYQSGKGPSPLKSTAKTPSFLSRLKGTQIDDANEHVEEDEETLKLEIAALEAKIRLKRLQNKGKSNGTPLPDKRTQPPGMEQIDRTNRASNLEVPLSPARRIQATVEQRSPNRVLLGIDKGKKATDISLRRPQSSADRTKERHNRLNDGLYGSGSASTYKSSRRIKANELPVVKSFSERLAESRESDRRIAAQRETAAQERATSFQIDRAEVQKYKEAAEARLTKQSGSHSKGDREETRATMVSDLSSEHDSEAGDARLFEGFSGLHLSSRILPHSFLKRTLPSDDFTIFKVPDLLRDVTSPAFELPDHVGNFVVFGVIASKSQPLDQKIKSDDQVKGNDEWEKRWEDGSQNHKKFMVFTITDLNWSINLYLFDTAVPRYHRLSPGTVIAVVNPAIMPPKPGREDTGAFSLSLHNSEDTLLEIGRSKHLGYCNALKKDGKECGSWVDLSRSEICEWHLNLEIAKTQAKRMGVNGGGNGYGRQGMNNKHNIFDPRMRGQGNGGGVRGALPEKQGRSFDRTTGTHYYVASSGTGGGGGSLASAPQFRSNMSAAKMLDYDIDDPFLAEGQFLRDRDARLQKRLASQEKEREISRQLGKNVSANNAGATYLRKRTMDAAAAAAASKTSSDQASQKPNCSQSSSLSHSNDKTHHQQPSLSELRSRIGRKRAAEDVQLSPVKKKRTRFLTNTGVKEAGRESVGLAQQVHKEKDNDDDDDDDDLDIV